MRLAVVGAAIDNPMAHRRDRCEADLIVEPIDQETRRRTSIEFSDISSSCSLPGGVSRSECGSGQADAVDFAMQPSGRVAHLINANLMLDEPPFTVKMHVPGGINLAPFVLRALLPPYANVKGDERFADVIGTLLEELVEQSLPAVACTPPSWSRRHPDRTGQRRGPAGRACRKKSRRLPTSSQFDPLQ